MSYQEKRTIVSLISTIVISLVYFAFMFQRYPQTNLDSTEAFKFWGTLILIFVPVQVVFKVLTLIVFSILNTVATREEEPPFTDERDRLIELKALRNFSYVFIAGFFLAMGTLALELPPSVMFSVLIISMVLAGVVDDASQLYFHRRGV